jgi:hypothetical protein
MPLVDGPLPSFVKSIAGTPSILELLTPLAPNYLKAVPKDPASSANLVLPL